MRSTPSSTARRRTLRALPRSAGQPQMPSPVIRIAPKPSRLTGRSPPNRKRELASASITAGEFAAKIMFDPPAISVAPPARVVPRNFRRVIELRDRRVRDRITTTPLLFASVVDLQSFHFLAATILIPFEGMMVLVRDLDYRADRSLYPRHHLHFAGVGKCFRRGVVRPFHGHYPSAHVINPRRRKLLFHVVVAVDRHPLKGEVFHFAISAGHFHASGMIADEITAVHD